jgi:imidazolonepropionase-like amidohydrolase
MRRLIAAFAALACAAAPAAAQTLAVTNGRVVTNTTVGIVEDGTVLIRDGEIVAAGANVTVPAGAVVIDADGGWVTPGVFAPVTQLGLIEVGAEDSARDDGADDSPFSAALDVADGFNPNGAHIPSSRIEGITRFGLFPSTGHDIFAGRGALGHTAGALFEERSFVFADMSQSGASRAGGSRPAAWAYLDAAFSDARGYPGRYATTADGLVLNRLDAQALLPAARGQIPLVIRVDRAADIRTSLRFGSNNPAVRLILVGGAEAWMVADELAAADVPVIIDPMRNLPESFDAIASNLSNASRLHEAGVTVAYMNGDLYFNARLLPQNAGNAVAHGVPWDVAFRSITLTPAEIFGVGDRYGALAPGYAGDVVVWDGDPLEVMSAPTAVIIDGEQTELSSRQTRLAERYRVIDDDEQAYRK